MSKPSTNYLEKVERWILGGVPIEKMAMRPDQRFRAVIAYEAYQIWLQDKQIQPMTVMRNLANREYPILLQKAKEGNVMAREYVESLKIRPGVPRTPAELANDVAVLNHLVSRFNVPVDAIEMAKVQDASDWLLREGKKMGDARAVKAGSDIKMQLYDSFKQKEDAADAMPGVLINITGDVSVIKRDRKNLTEAEIESLRRKFQLSKTDIEEMYQEQDAEYTDFEEVEDFDIFKENEQEFKQEE